MYKITVEGQRPGIFFLGRCPSTKKHRSFCYKFFGALPLPKFYLISFSEKTQSPTLALGASTSVP